MTFLSQNRYAFAVVCICVGGALFWGFSSRKVEDSAPTERETPHLDGNAIRFSKRFATRAGLAYAEVEDRELSPVVDVTGVASFDPARLAVVGARIDGRIHAVFKKRGDTISAGDVIAEMESIELGRAQTDVLKTRAKEVAASAEETRTASLAAEKIISAREAEAAKAQAVAARAERSAAESAVRALGGEPDSKDIGLLRIRSPIAGELISIAVHRGQVVDAKTNVFKVADLSQIWVELDVFEQDILAIRERDAVELQPQGTTMSPLQGKVDYVAKVIDHETRSAQVRVVLDNTAGLLRPGQALRGRILASGPKAKWLSVPIESVVRVDGKPTVFISTGDESVEVRKVELGPQTKAYAAILSGVKPGEQVVSKGVFALKSEIFR